MGMKVDTRKMPLDSFLFHFAKFTFKPMLNCGLIPGGEYEGDSPLTQYMFIVFKWLGVGFIVKTRFNG